MLAVASRSRRISFASVRSCRALAIQVAAVAVVGCVAGSHTHAATRYWDIADDADGLDGGVGVWSTAVANWNTAADGSASPTVAWASGDAAVFDSAGTYTVTASGTPQAASVAFKQGSVTISGTIQLNTSGTITADAAAGTTVLGTINLQTGSDSTRTITNNGSGLLSTGTITRASASSNHAMIFAGSGDITVATLGNLSPPARSPRTARARSRSAGAPTRRPKR